MATSLKFRKIATVPSEGLEVGTIYFETSTSLIYVASSATTKECFSGVKNASFDDESKVLTITNSVGDNVSLDFSDMASADSVTQALANKLNIGTEADTAGTKSYWGLKKDIAAAQSAATAAGQAAATEAVTNAVNALDVDDTAQAGQYVSSVKQTDGKIAVTRKAFSGSEIPVGGNEEHAEDTIDSAIENLYDLVNAATTSGVTELNGQTGDIEIATGDANGQIKVGTVNVSVKGLADTAFMESSEFATAGQGAKADTAIQEVTANTSATDFLDVTATEGIANSVAINVAPKFATLSTESEGLVKASDVREYVKSVQGSVMRYKGTKATYEDLPEDAVIGDVYNVTAVNGSYPAGTNYAWDGSAWDPLGSEIDLTNYATHDDLDALNGSNIKVDSTAEAMTIKAKLDALDSAISAKPSTDTNTTYTFANGSDGSFTVTPSDGSAQTVSIGKPATAGTADQVAHSLTISLNGTAQTAFTGIADVAFNITPESIGAIKSVNGGNNGHLTITADVSNSVATINGSLDTQAVSSSSSEADGLATAYDVKQYVDSQITSGLTWAEFV